MSSVFPITLPSRSTRKRSSRLTQKFFSWVISQTKLLASQVTSLLVSINLATHHSRTQWVLWWTGECRTHRITWCKSTAQAQLPKAISSEHHQIIILFVKHTKLVIWIHWVNRFRPCQLVHFQLNNKARLKYRNTNSSIFSLRHIMHYHYSNNCPILSGEIIFEACIYSTTFFLSSIKLIFILSISVK